MMCISEAILSAIIMLSIGTGIGIGIILTKVGEKIAEDL